MMHSESEDISSNYLTAYRGEVSVSAKSTKGRKAAKQMNVAQATCPGCGILEGSVADKQLSCDWLACRDCKTWYHEHSAENHGILDDEHFLCKCCV